MEPAFFSRGDTRTPMNIAITCLFSNAILNAIFFALNFGYVGIVLSSVISSYLNLTLLLTKLIGKKHFHFEKNFLNKLLRILIPSVLMALALFLMREYFNVSEALNRIIELIIMIACGFVVYGTASYFSGSLDILLQSNFLRRKKNDVPTTTS